MFGLCGSLGALLIEYIYLTTKNKGRIPAVKGIQCKLFGHTFSSLLTFGKMGQDKKLMQSRMHSGMKEYPRSRKKRRQKKSHETKNVHGIDNRGMKH